MLPKPMAFSVSRRQTRLRIAALVAMGSLWTSLAWTQASQPSGGPPKTAKSPTSPRAVQAQVESRPRWAELTAMQQRALRPLASSWRLISEGQKQKWLALSRNFAELPPPEQNKLHERMGEWVALSANERHTARMNYAQVKKLSADDKQAKWEAYRALTDDERRSLAQQAPRTPSGAAPALKPVQRLANLPPKVDNRRHVPRIATSPHQVDRNTLLPQVDDPDTGFTAAEH